MPRRVAGTFFAQQRRVRGRRFILLLSGALLCFVAVVALDLCATAPYLRICNFLRDAIAREGRRTPPNPDLVFLAIDSASVSLDESADLQQLYGLRDPSNADGQALRLMSKRWPWSREVYALVLDRLVNAGAKVVLFDLTFPTATDDDAPFRAALERHREHVVIGSNFVSSSDKAGDIPSHTRPPETLIPQTDLLDDRIGYTNFWPDGDDVVRAAQFRTPSSREEVFLSLAARGLTKAGYGSCVPTGLDERSFRYTAPPREGFRPHSIFEIFVPDYWQHNYKSGEFFRGKIVLIGAEGNWQHDEHGTPFGLMPGPELHLNAINAALHHEFIREASSAIGVITVVAAAIAAIVLSLAVRSPWLRLIGLGVANCIVWAVTLQAFNHLSLQLPSFPAFLQLNFTVLVGLVCDFAGERIEKTRLRRTFEKYVSRDVVRELLDHPRAAVQSLGGVIKPATILFSDIRGYSSVSARSDPQALVAQLNEYLTAMVDCVFRHGGTLDKFIGDAVMAVWGNVRSNGPREDAINAVRAALAMKRELARLNESWTQAGLPKLTIGIAINHGDVVVGNIGSPQRMEFTVIGDAVNVSWKLQELTKEYGAAIIVGESVAPLVLEEFDLRSLGQAEVRGASKPLQLFALERAVEVPNLGAVV